MCGIAGFFSTSNFFSKEDLFDMTKVLGHRGPDAEGYFTDKCVGLGHKRLSILDLSPAANQPMHSHCGNFLIIYNGEVYNYKELALKYNLSLKTTCDTEVILEAYIKIGPKILNELNGMFAFAIYNKTEKKLLIARDRIGIKPLFYYWDGKTFAFASELKSFFQIKKISFKEINKQAIANFLYLGYIPEPETIYTKISKFPSGKYLEIDSSGFKITSYWNLKDQINAATISDIETAKPKLKQLIESSVSYRLISDVPFGVFLSGGVDSSLLTAVACKVTEQKIKTFSIGFRENKYNELIYARKIAKYFNTEHYEFVVTHEDAFQLIDEMTNLFDEPFADSSAIPTLLVSKLAKEHVTMTLSGDGGDELFYGYGAYTWAKRLANPLIDAVRNPIHKILDNLPNNTYKRAALLFNYPNPKRIKSHIFSQEQYNFTTDEIDYLLSTEYKKNICFDENYEGLKRNLSAVEEQALFDLQFYLKDDLLVKVDRATMAHSLETRVPFLDDRIISFALNLDEQLKLKGKNGKFILKEVLYDYVPKKYFDRPKWGFSIPLKDWLKTDLRYLIDEYTSEKTIKEYNVVNYVYVKNLVNKFYAGHDYLYNRIWLIIILHKWLKKHYAI